MEGRFLKIAVYFFVTRIILRNFASEIRSGTLKPEVMTDETLKKGYYEVEGIM